MQCLARTVRSLVCNLVIAAASATALAQAGGAEPPAPAQSQAGAEQGRQVAAGGKLQSGEPRPQPKPAVLQDPAGPAIGLETSEALFDVAVALNACGYDTGLEESDPVRQRVRDQVNQAAMQSAEARDARDQLCRFIGEHRLADSTRDLAQYVSLALFLTPPPELAMSADEADLPPDATQAIGMLPALRSFARATQLHLIWVANRPAYEAEVARLHDPLTGMIVSTNTYLKMPASTYDGRRFLVLIEPLLSPSATNARVYGADYVVVVSPANGTVHMDQVRHSYLHYEIEPLLLTRYTAMDRLLPLLKTVREAALDFTYRTDIGALVIESLIRAVEARTMSTGVPEFHMPENVARADVPRYERERQAYLQKVAAVREAAVQRSMTQGFVLTHYFYDQLAAFERTPASLKESIGEMVYGMDVDQQVHRARDIQFAAASESDVVRRAPRTPRGLDVAELKLMKGDAEGARQLALQSLKDRTQEVDRANFILARASLLKGDMESAQTDFEETLRTSKDPRLLAWSHIYLGRILDVQDERDRALTEYRAALTVRDGQQDTKIAAERGLKQPFELPHRDSPPQ